MEESKVAPGWLGSGFLSWINAILSVLGARVFAAGAAFLGNVLIARFLGPEDFNSFYVLFAIMSLVAGLTGPAVDTSLVRFAVKHIQPGDDRSAPYFTFAFYVKCGLLVVTMLAAVVCAGPILEYLSLDTSQVWIPKYAVILAFFGGAVVSMWGFAQSYFQAHMKFGHYAGYEFCSSLLRLGLVIGLIGAGSSNVVYYLAAYVSAPLTMAIMSWTQLPKALFTAQASIELGRQFFHFAKWVLLATLFTTATQRLDLFLLNLERFHIPKETVGHYSAALSLVLAGELVLLTFYNVLLPKASALKGPGELRRFIGHFRIPSMLFCLGLSLMIPLAGPFRKLAFGPAYLGTEAYFTILLLGVIVSLACAPPTTALYALGKSHTIALFEGVRLVLTIGAGLLVVPEYGVYGMAWVMTIVRASVSAVTYLVAHQMVKRLTIAEYMGETA